MRGVPTPTPTMNVASQHWRVLANCLKPWKHKRELQTKSYVCVSKIAGCLLKLPTDVDRDVAYAFRHMEAGVSEAGITLEMCGVPVQRALRRNAFGVKGPV